MAVCTAGANRNPMPISRMARAASSGGSAIAMPRLPAGPRCRSGSMIERLPCLATRTPAPATTNAAMVEMLNVHCAVAAGAAGIEQRLARQARVDPARPSRAWRARSPPVHPRSRPSCAAPPETPRSAPRWHRRARIACMASQASAADEVPALRRLRCRYGRRDML